MDEPALGAYVAVLRVTSGATIALIDRVSLRTSSVCTTEDSLRPTDALALDSESIWFSENSNDYLAHIRVSDC